MKRVASVAVVDRRDAILFIRRRDNQKWSLPGGHLNEGEDPLEGALRELWEETGIKAPKGQLKALGSGVVKDRYEVFAFEYRPSKGITVDFGNDPDEEADEYCWFDEDSDSDYASGIPSNVHVPNDCNVTLILMGRVSNGGDVKINKLAKMAIANLTPGQAGENDYGEETFNYNHMLPDTHKHYSLHVTPNRAKDVLYVSLRNHQGKPVGNIKAPVEHGAINPHSHLEDDHHGYKLGTAMYEALYAHAYHKLGIKSVVGGNHSEAAGRVHDSLARKHGLEYKPKDIHPAWARRFEGLPTMSRGPYDYTLKSEDWVVTYPLK